MMGRVTPKTNRQLAERLRSLWRRLRAKHTVTWRHVAGHSGNKWNDYVDELAARGRQGDRGSNAAEWADGTIPTNTPDEESSAEGGDSSTIGHGATGGGQDSEREDDSDADCGPATPTATSPTTILPGRRRSRICYGLSLDTQHARRLGNMEWYPQTLHGAGAPASRQWRFGVALQAVVWPEDNLDTHRASGWQASAPTPPQGAPAVMRALRRAL